MILNTVDSIVRLALLESGKPIHYYLEYLVHTSTAIRELTFDTLQVVKTVMLPTNSYAAATLPDDFVDDVSVCIPAGQSLSRLPKQDWITPLRLKDSTGAFIPYSTNSDDSDGTTVWDFPGGATFFWNINDFGEFTGKFYGSRGGSNSGYQIFPERRQLQMSEDFIDSHIVMIYMSDGQSADSAAQVDARAVQTIKAFQAWKASPNRDNEFSPEGRHYYNQRRMLRARMDQLDRTTILNIIRNSYSAGIKG